MPGLTEDAVVLATSQETSRQIIPSVKHYAQAHLEFDPEAVDLLIAGTVACLNKVKNPLFKT